MQFQPINLPFRLRQSSLETSRCLFRFHKEHVLGIREPEGEFSQRGSHFHALAKQYVDYLRLSHQEMDWSYAQELADGGTWSPEAVGIFKDWALRRSFQPAAIYATELKLRLGWDLTPCADEDAVWSGDLDLLELVDQDATILDFKSHFRPFEPTTIQSVLYPWLLLKVMPDLQTVTFKLEFVRWGITRSRTFDRSHLESMDSYIGNLVNRLVAAYQADEWPAMINAGCAYCRHECPLVK